MFLAFRSMLRDPEAKILALTAIVTIAVGSVVYMLIEGWTPIEAVYFCVVTLATVGYGDLHPTTPLGQLFTVGYILVGVGIIAAFISELAKHRAIARDGDGLRRFASPDEREGTGRSPRP
jgi:voltage-gated potassium channel